MSEAKLKEVPRNTAPAVLEMSWDLTRMGDWKHTTSRSYRDMEHPSHTAYTICVAALWDTISNGGVLVVSSENGALQVIQRPLTEQAK